MKSIDSKARSALSLGAALLASVLALVSPVSAAQRPFAAQSGHQPLVASPEAVTRAVNRWSDLPAAVELNHPRHQMRFAADGVHVSPRLPQLTWSWSLRRLGSASAGDRVVAGSVAPTRVDQKVHYERGAVLEEYIAKPRSVEQRFWIREPLHAAGEDLIIEGEVASNGTLEAHPQGWLWRNGAKAVVSLGQVTVYDASGRQIDASMSLTATSPAALGRAELSTFATRIVIAAAALQDARYPLLVDPEIGSNDFQISDMGNVNDDVFYADQPAVAYNSAANEYLVVWVANDNTGSLDPDEFEVFGQRIDAATGAAVGSDDFRISNVGPDGDSDFFASNPVVVYNSVDNQYLVAWQGNGNDDQELDIYGQLLTAAGVEVGADFRISDLGNTGDTTRSAFSVALAYDADLNEYLAVWSGDDLIDNEFEIWGQRLSAAGVELGSNDFRISNMGTDGSNQFSAFSPAVAYNPAAAEYMVVWYGEDNVSPLVDNEFEIFAQRLAAVDASAAGADDFRVSDMGPDGNTDYSAAEPAIAYDSVDNQYLVVWSGTDNTPPLVLNEFETWGQRLSATGAEVGTEFVLSSMGPDGSISYGAFAPDVTYDSDRNEYLVVWYGDDDTPPLVEGELEIFGQLVDSDSGAEIGTDFAISDMDDFAYLPAVVYAPTTRQYLAVWPGSEDGLDQEIFGQRLGNCGGGTLEPGEECEAPFDACCDPATCTFKAPTEICRPATGLCDAAETCGGTSADCPSDVLDTGSLCRPAAGDCDLADFCDGSGINCPADDVEDVGVSCRVVAGICDVAEVCDGSDPQCPSDDFVDAGTGCRPSAGDCDLAETCAGDSADCPANSFAGPGTTCRAAADVCDVDESCSGGGADCPADDFKPNTELCRGSAGPCDAIENCTGSGSACPSDAFTSGNLCRPSAGDCDVGDNCDGSGAACPPDAVADTSQTCRPVADICDVGENCDGTNTDCPTDVFTTAGTSCRAAAGICDEAESCTGSAADCPIDDFAASSVICRGSADVCDLDENCTGAGADCPADDFKPNTEVCRGSAGPCDVIENCTGSGSACPSDSFTSGNLCRPTAGDCDLAENCDGSGAACPPDAVSDTSQTCRPVAGICDLGENCDGTNTDCPTDVFTTAGTNCRAVAGICDLAESCTGSAADCPIDDFVASSVTCRGSAGVCDLAENCSGGDAECPGDSFAGSSVVCRPPDSSGCDATETCDSASPSCPPDMILPDNSACSDLDVCTNNEECIAGVCIPSQIPGCSESFVGYKSKAPEADPAGAPLNNLLPEGFVVTGDDIHLTGGNDDPENLLLVSSIGVLVTAGYNGDAPTSEATYVRYKAKGGPETAGAIGLDGFYPKAVKHLARVWSLTTPLGTIDVASKRVTSVLVPAGLAVSPGTAAAADTTHYLCYAVHPIKTTTVQTPDGKFDKTLQGFFQTSLFDDCALDQEGGVPFQSTAVASHCLFNAKKVVDLCNPASLAAAEAPRQTTATITPVLANTTQSLLCYKPKLSVTFANNSSAALGGGIVGAEISPKQSKHVPHEYKRDTPMNSSPASQFPVPAVVETKGTDRFCIPATVVSVVPKI